MEATIGGTKRHLLDLVAEIDRNRFELEVACPAVRSESHGDTSFVDDLRAVDVRLHLMPMVRALNPIADARTAAVLAGLIRRGGFDIVHTHSTKAGATGRLAAMTRPGVRCVHTPHGFYFLNFAAPLKRELFRMLERGLGVRTQRLIALSPSERRVAETVVPARKIRLVPNSFDPFTPYARREARRRLGLPPDLPIVGTTARFTHQKSPFDIVAAFAEIHRVHPKARFLWINGGELKVAVERRLAEQGLLDLTSRPGYLAEARELLPAMDVYLHLARWEGVPYAVMEAMTAGVPVVGARAVGTMDLIDDQRTGLLVEPGAGGAAGRAAAELLTHPQRARTIAKAASESVSKRHDRAAMARATEEVYRDLMRIA